MAHGSKATGAGYALVIALGALFLIAGILHWLDAGFDTGRDLSYIGYVAFIVMGLATSVHLWSRTLQFDSGSSIRTLFTLMGISFVIISTIFLYYIVDSLLRYAGMPSMSELIDGAMEQLRFDMFGIEGFRISMPLSSVVTFAFIMLGVSFFIYPLEKYVKSRRPWFAISMWACLAFMPVMVLVRDNVWIVSIATFSIVLFVLVNFIFMFYLYIALAVNSAGRMRTASVLVAVGLFTMIFVWVMGLGLFDDKTVQSIVQFAIGLTSLSLFNAGFYIMRS